MHGYTSVIYGFHANNVIDASNSEKLVNSHEVGKKRSRRAFRLFILLQLAGIWKGFLFDDYFLPFS